VFAALVRAGAWLAISRRPAAPPETPAPVAAPSQPPAVRPVTVTATHAALVKHGIAAAVVPPYGDLILGQPEDNTIASGYYEAPRPTLWDRAEIPYQISADLPRPERVMQAIRYFNEKTTVSFVPYEGQPDALVFEPGDEHCYSLLGKIGGMQPIKLSGECEWNEIAHEIMHALGFVHEQSRTDRDSFVEVLWDDIEEKYRDQFAIVPETFMEAAARGPFDYHSIMLYPPTLFAAHAGAPTMRSRTDQPIAPARDGLSAGDLEKVSAVYPSK
jgi:hypothetical protein